MLIRLYLLLVNWFLFLIALGSPAHREISLAQIFLHLTVLNIEYGLIGFYFAVMQHFHFQSGQQQKNSYSRVLHFNYLDQI